MDENVHPLNLMVDKKITDLLGPKEMGLFKIVWSIRVIMQDRMSLVFVMLIWQRK